MTWWGAVAACAMLVAALTCSAQAQDLDQSWARCVNVERRQLADDKIAACTEVIDAGALEDERLAFALGMRGSAYHSLRDFTHAIADYSESIRLNPQVADVFRSRGLAYQNMRPANYDLAIADATSPELLAPEDWAPPSDRADARRARGECAEAIADYTRSIELDASRIWNFTHRAQCYEELGDTERAQQDYARAIRLDPTDANDYFSRGVAYHARRDWRRAIDDYSRTIRLDPHYPDAYRSRGLAYQNVRPANYNRAIADATMAESLAPNEWGPPSDRADAYMAQGEYALAIFDYTRAIDLDPSQAWNFTHRARAFQALGDSVRAEADRQEAARLSQR